MSFSYGLGKTVSIERMIYNVHSVIHKDVMIPRIDMTFIDVDSTYQELMDIFKEDMHTRFPVYEDNTDNVIGIINIKFFI